jgi:survival-of-motor-neuron-related-splicing factor 30
MSADEIAGYRYQLEQIEASLESDPQNSELIKLKNDLLELIALTTQYESVQSPAVAIQAKKEEKPKTTEEKPSSTTAPLFQQYSVGQEVMAKYHADGKYYKAKISNVGGSGVVYSVIFVGYQDVEIVKAEEIKPIDNKNKNKNKRPADAASEESDGAQKQAQVKKVKKPAAVEVKKNAWLNFANKAEKKKKTSAIPINKKSIFKTPDNPEGKGKAAAICREEERERETECVCVSMVILYRFILTNPLFLSGCDWKW